MEPPNQPPKAAPTAVPTQKKGTAIKKKVTAHPASTLTNDQQRRQGMKSAPTLTGPFAGANVPKPPKKAASKRKLDQEVPSAARVRTAKLDETGRKKRSTWAQKTQKTGANNGVEHGDINSKTEEPKDESNTSDNEPEEWWVDHPELFLEAENCPPSRDLLPGLLLKVEGCTDTKVLEQKVESFMNKHRTRSLPATETCDEQKAKSANIVFHAWVVLDKLIEYNKAASDEEKAPGGSLMVHYAMCFMEPSKAIADVKKEVADVKTIDHARNLLSELIQLIEDDKIKLDRARKAKAQLAANFKDARSKKVKIDKHAHNTESHNAGLAVYRLEIYRDTLLYLMALVKEREQMLAAEEAWKD